eukprot:GEMP01064570.1.p1 GENE.GEMP01064570.1~~GEMP01064570.1.p1  ORF type:complete len:396 (+),score=87.35 GEMP01064570.1:84-1271(+)
MAVEEETTKVAEPLDDHYYPNMELIQLQSKLDRLPKDPEAASWKTQLMEIIKEDQMGPYYENIAQTVGLTIDQKLLGELKAKNDEEIKKIDDKKADAEENLGETEVKDALVEKATYLCRIGDKEKALEAYEVAYSKIVGIGQKLDVLLTRCRIGYFFEETNLVKKNLDMCHEQLLKGGDWERKNKLKVYEGLFAIQTRDFKRAAELLIDATATFTATELMSMKNFVLYCVITAMCGMSRNDLRKSLVSCPEILSVIPEWPYLKEFMHAYFYRKYDDFMRHFVTVVEYLRKDHFLERQSRYIVRVLRLNAFRQFLASYKSVTISAMAEAFGVSNSFIDKELSAFITSSKLSCKIDKVAGIIESNVADARNTMYSQIVKQGDLLLNHMQKVASAVDR